MQLKQKPRLILQAKTSLRPQTVANRARLKQEVY